MKAYILSALSLVLFAQKSVQEDSPAQKACTALRQKYPELTAYGLDPRYSTANTGMFLLLYLRYVYWLLIRLEWNDQTSTLSAHGLAQHACLNLPIVTRWLMLS